MEWNVYSDGSRHCSRDTNGIAYLPGGWACVIQDKKHRGESVLSGSALTKNIDRMELLGAVEGFSFIDNHFPLPGNQVTLYSDNRYVFDQFLNCLPVDKQKIFLRHAQVSEAWRRNKWPSRTRKEDYDLTEKLTPILQRCFVTYHKVTKVTAPEQHQRCDALARQVRQQFAEKLGFRIQR